jgi:hypothetical protein
MTEHEKDGTKKRTWIVWVIIVDVVLMSALAIWYFAR